MAKDRDPKTAPAGPPGWLPDLPDAPGLPDWLDDMAPPELPAAKHPSPQPPPRSGEGEMDCRNPSPQPPPRSGEGEVPSSRAVSYGIVARNTTAAPIVQVRVEHELPAGVRYLASEPQAQCEGNRLVWDLGDLAVGAQHLLKVRVALLAGAALPADGRALFTIRQGLQASTLILRPGLTVTMAAPAPVRVGVPSLLRVCARNPGMGPTAGVVLRLGLPSGLRLSTGDASVSVGDLASGQKVNVTFSLIGAQAGAFPVEVVARADGDLRATAQAEIAIRGPRKSEAALGPSPEDTGPALQRLLAELSAEAGAVPAERPPSPVVRRDAGRYVLFALAGTAYAVPIEGVLETCRPPAITPVPNVPDWVLGVANVRGDIVSLVDLRVFLGLEAARPGQGRLLVVRAGTEVAVGLLVDQVKGICALPAGRVRKVALREHRLAPYLGGVIDLDGRLLVVLDLERLLLSPELRQFELV